MHSNKSFFVYYNVKISLVTHISLQIISYMDKHVFSLSDSKLHLSLDDSGQNKVKQLKVDLFYNFITQLSVQVLGLCKCGVLEASSAAICGKIDKGEF